MGTQALRTNGTALPRAVDLDELGATVDQAVQEVNGDPSMSIEQHALGRAEALVQEMTGGARRLITQARDTLDDLMRAHEAAGAALEAALNKYAADTTGSAKLVGVIMRPIEEHARIVGEGLKPAPGKTVTAR